MRNEGGSETSRLFHALSLTDGRFLKVKKDPLTHEKEMHGMAGGRVRPTMPKVSKNRAKIDTKYGLMRMGSSS